MLVTSTSNLNRFIIFHYCKEKEIPNTNHVNYISHHTLIMLPHYFGRLKSSNLSQMWKVMQTKKCHMNQLSLHSYWKIKTMSNLYLPALYFCGLMIGIQAVKIRKSDLSVCCTFSMEWTRASLTMQLTSGVGVFVPVCKHMVDTLSSCCDNNNIHSAA